MHMRPVDVPEDGGQVVPDGGSVAEASALGRRGAHPLRDDTSGRSSPMSPATRDTSTEQRAGELATEQAALRRGANPGAREAPTVELFPAAPGQGGEVFPVAYPGAVPFEPGGAPLGGGVRGADHQPMA